MDTIIQDTFADGVQFTWQETDMKQLVTAICVACAMGAVVAAQHESMPAGKPGQSQKTHTRKSQPTRVTGCVAEGADIGRYILINATVSGDTTSRSYDLIGGDLKSHVGHTVEITGTTADGNATGKDKMLARDKRGVTETRTALTVKSVKLHWAKCS